MLAPLLRIAIALIALLVIATVVVWAIQERLVFPPPPVPAKQGRNAERVEYTAADAQQLFGFLVRPPAGVAAMSEGLIIVFHGNGDLADSWVDWAREAARRTGWTVLLAEYRGYGGLTGRPSYKGVMADARAAMGFAQTQLKIPPAGMVLFGHSIGTGVVAQLAVEFDVRAVVMESPITSVVDMGRRSFGPPLSWVLPMISRVDFAPIDRAPGIRAPVWVAVGERDDVAPPDMGRAVFGAAREKGELLSVANAGHGDVSDRGGANYWEWLARALAR